MPTPGGAAGVGPSADSRAARVDAARVDAAPQTTADARKQVVRVAEKQHNHAGKRWNAAKKRLVLAGVGRPAKQLRRAIRRAEARTDLTVVCGRRTRGS